MSSRSTKASFSYDKGAFEREGARQAREPEGYSYEKIEFDAAYGNERVTAHFYRPSHAKPPYQTVIYFPPAHTLYQEHFDETDHFVADRLHRGERSRRVVSDLQGNLRETDVLADGPTLLPRPSTEIT